MIIPLLRFIYESAYLLFLHRFSEKMMASLGYLVGGKIQSGVGLGDPTPPSLKSGPRWGRLQVFAE
jgi:hypothetical protein